MGSSDSLPRLTEFVRQAVKEAERTIARFFRREGEASGYLEVPVTLLQQEQGGGNGLRYGLGAMQGRRAEMEDAHTAVAGLPPPLDAWSFFAVFDGHGGARVARYCSRHLLRDVTGEWGRGGRPSVESVKSGTRRAFLRIDGRMRRRWWWCRRLGGWGRSGSTAVVVAVSPTHVYLINCGDSRALLCRGGRACFQTEEHRPTVPRELERIRRAGGAVSGQRLNGSLAVSRALGDFYFKAGRGRGQAEQLVSPEPEVCAVERSEADQFAVLACDGVWDVLGDQELCRFVCSRLQLTDSLEEVCAQVLKLCLYKGSMDNMSIILVCFPNAPKVSEEAIRREEELNAYIEQKVTETFKEQLEEGEPNLFYVMQSLAMEEIPNLPPGGGLSSKRDLIIDIYKRLKDEYEGLMTYRESEESL